MLARLTIFFKLLVVVKFLLYNSIALAQVCPANIDFENGSFSGWTCYTGTVAAPGNTHQFSLTQNSGPQSGRHTLVAASDNEMDYFGGFPAACPNGSGYSIKLGNNIGGGQAEGVSYQFTIPANRNTYSITYYYAVVFQDPNHQIFQQPRLEIESLNVTDKELITCSSFAFFPNGSPLPGFFLSPIRQDTTQVWCKNWSAVTLNLNGKAGKTIKLTFKTGDCVFRRHFGYAYIDVNTECESEFVGANYCVDDTAVTVTGPFGYASYKWMNQNFTQILGNDNTLTLQPPPPSGTTIALEVTPYFGYGCVDTFYAKLIDTLKLRPNAGPDVTFCGTDAVRLGQNPKQGVRYSWSPVAGLDNPSIANPKANPSVNTTYVLTVTSLGGGCLEKDSVEVYTFVADTSITLVGKPFYCIINNDSAVLYANQEGAVQWYRNNIPILGATQKRFRVSQSGNYYAIVAVENGCVVRTASQQIEIETPEPGIRYPQMAVVKNKSIPLQARTIGVTAQWQPAIFLSSANEYKPIYRGDKDTTYTIKLTTQGQCITIDTLAIRVFEFQEIFVPSVFTPNNDGINDYVFPIAAGFTAINYFKIYNRWGQQVYNWSKNSRGWDGRFRNQIQENNTYVWMAEALDADGNAVRKKGTIVLLK